jgi:2-polyprenyl-3-methyl-5-hydroxy-6-metoxy-1,4-benzoquinol methylase
LLLQSPRLDGPLVRCRRCGLVYVGARQANFAFSGFDPGRSGALARRVSELQIVRPEVEEAEQAWRLEAEQHRLDRVRSYVAHGSLLDVGCSVGTFLSVARQAFAATGVEPDPSTSAQARAQGLDVVTGTLAEVTAPSGGFDVATMFHVIEHLGAPRAALRQVRALLRPGGLLMVETPTIDCLWFHHALGHWRQLIPDHYFFFSRNTLARTLTACDLEPISFGKVGRRASLRFLVDRLRRSGVRVPGGVPGLLERLQLCDRSIYVNPGDIMWAVARAPDRRRRPSYAGRRHAQTTRALT